MFKVGGAQELKQVAFFSTIDFNKLGRKEVPPPIAVSGEMSDNFHEEFLKQEVPRSVGGVIGRSGLVRSERFKGFSVVVDEGIGESAASCIERASNTTD